MARKQLRVSIPQADAFGRDKGKAFHIEEMSAAAAESWAMRAFLALARSEAAIPDDVAAAGMAGVAEYGLKVFSGLKYDEAQPLLEEMFACIQMAPDKSHPDVLRNLVADDIEEVYTRLYLRGKVFELHTGFSLAAAQSKLNKSSAAEGGASSSTPMSLERSAQ